eukprot:5491327-Amphidinium_carterae.1
MLDSERCHTLSWYFSAADMNKRNNPQHKVLIAQTGASTEVSSDTSILEAGCPHCLSDPQSPQKPTASTLTDLKSSSRRHM